MTEQDQTNGGAPAEPTNADREEAQRLHDDIKSRETPELIGKITEFQQAVAAEALEAGGAMLPEGLTPEIMAQASAMERRVAPTVRQVFGTCLRGMLVSAPGVPPQVLLAVVAWQMGNLLATAFNADLATTLTIRKNLKDGFADGITKAPIPKAPPLPPAPSRRRN